MAETPHMKIIKLQSENVKRLKAVEIVPDGNVVTIAGRNSQGKSSVLDSIWMALGGGAGAKDTSRPIRDGEETAFATLDLGDLIVTRKWNASGTTTLEVKAADGARYPSPQTILDGLIGKLSFDPLAFAEEDAKGQLAMLLSVVELPFDPVELDKERKRVFDERTDANREVKSFETQLKALPAVNDDTPDEEISAASIAKELEDAEATNKRVDEFEAEKRSADREVERLETELQAARDRQAENDKVAPELPERVDVEAIRSRLSELDETNELVRARKQRKRLQTDLTSHTKNAAKLTAELTKIDQSKEDAIAAASMPLEGLSFDEEGVLYNGVPFGQCSASERLRVGIAIAMALNPTIRVIRITDGSLLDSENLALIEQMANEHDFQIWIERVDETGTVGITIEDGMVVEGGK